MRVDRFSVDLDEGLSAHFFRSHHGVSLSIGNSGEPEYRAPITLYAPPSMSSKFERIAEAINNIMAEDDNERSAA